MELDKQEHRQFLLEMMEQVSFPGKILDLAHEVKQAILSATLTDVEEEIK